MKSASRFGARGRGAGLARSVEPLESRLLFASQLVQPINNFSVPQGTASQSAELNNLFTDPQAFSPDLTFTVRSDNPTVVAASLVGSQLTLNYSATQTGYAHVNVVATDPSGNVSSDTFSVKVTGLAADSGDVVLGKAGKNSFRIVGQNGTPALITLSGPGTADLHISGNLTANTNNRVKGKNEFVESITLSGTTPATALRIVGHPRIVGKGKARSFAFPTIGDITTDGSFGVVNVANTVLDGDITVAGSVNRFVSSYADGGSITIGNSPRPMTFAIGSFTDENFTSGTPVRLFSGSQWINSSSAGTSFSAPYIHRLFTAGSFFPGLQLSGKGPSGRSLDNIYVGGFVSGAWRIAGPSAALTAGSSTSDWNAQFASVPKIVFRGNLEGSLTAPVLPSLTVRGSIAKASLNFTQAGTSDLPRLSVRGEIFQSFIQAAGSVGSVSALDLNQSAIFAGVGQLASGQTLPQTLSDFTQTSSIASVSLHPRGRLIGFTGSGIAAYSIGTLALGTTRTVNAGNAFGVAAHQIGHLTARDVSDRQTINLNQLQDPSGLQAEIAAEHLTLHDFLVRLI